MLAGCALVLALAGAARAERVLVLAGGEPPCVRAAELAAALGRHGQLATVVRAVPEQSDTALVGVRATAAGLEVRLLRPSGLSERVIATPPCEVAVEVVAAWVASVLDGSLLVAPPPVDPAPAAAPPQATPVAAPRPPIDIRAAVLSELAWVGFDLEERGYDLNLSGHAGNWRVVLTRDGCVLRRAIGGVPATHEAAVTRLVAAVGSMLGAPDGCLRSEASPEQRRRLGRAIASTLKEKDVPAQAIFSVGAGALSFVASALDQHSGDDHENLLKVGGSFLLVGGVVGWGLDDQVFAEPMMDTLMWSGAGLSSEGLGMRPEAIAYLTQGGIELVEGLFNPPAPRARLRSHVRRMTGPNPPSSADIVAAERDLKWAHSQFYRIITAVNFIGAAMGAATAEPDDGVTTEERRMHDQQSVTSTVVLLALGAGLVLEPTRWSSYRSRVDAGVRLDVTPTAGGATLSARGRF